MLKILFIDRDGTLIEEPEDKQVDSLEKIKLMPGVISSLHSLSKLGYRFVMVSNQDGLGTDSFPEENFQVCQNFLLELFQSQKIEFEDVFVCPHWDHDNCDCRKPRTGLLTQFLAANTLDLVNCAVVGDRQTDMEFAEHLGLRGIPVSLDNAEQTWADVVTVLTPNQRIASDKRVTHETSVEVSVNLDQTTPIAIDTGLGFFDHMLEQIAKHGGFALRLKCVGDTNVDEHHTIEDTAITLGKALRLALGEKRGIARFGYLLPMDESEARVSLDLSGRAYCKFDGDFPRDRVGQLPTEMVRHFFQSLADSLGATIHISVVGENTHHMVEACFKAVGRTLRQAIQIENDNLPSTKGVLS
jgi:imidazoleglycerol-phosphate dehydratase/histidinol-phosphatase